MAKFDIQEATRVIHQLRRGLRDAQNCMQDVAARLDLANVGQSKWQLMRTADAVEGLLRRVGLDTEPDP